MALHDPAQDEINQQLRSSIPARRFGIAGQVQDLVGKGELTPEAGERVSLNARANFERNQRLAREQEEARRVALEQKRSKAFLNRRQGQASLATANAALAKARKTAAGGDKATKEALLALGFSPEEAERFDGKLSPTTARASAENRSSRRRAEQAEEKLKFQREKEVSAVERRSREFKLKQITQSQRNASKEIADILKNKKDLDPKFKKSIQDLLDKSLADVEGKTEATLEEKNAFIDQALEEAGLLEVASDADKESREIVLRARELAREAGKFVPE